MTFTAELSTWHCTFRTIVPVRFNSVFTFNTYFIISRKLQFNSRMIRSGLPNSSKITCFDSPKNNFLFPLKYFPFSNLVYDLSSFEYSKRTFELERNSIPVTSSSFPKSYLTRSCFQQQSTKP
eukprot:UN03954